MDSSLLSASPAVHFKVVLVAFVCATIVVLVGLNARTGDVAAGHVQTKSAVVKAGQAVMYAAEESTAVR
jgi:hypothetical protein